MPGRESRIRDAAYRLWEQAGRPEAHDDRFWHEAERLIAAEEAPPAGAAKSVKPKAPAKPRTAAAKPAKASPEKPAVKSAAGNASKSTSKTASAPPPKKAVVKGESNAGVVVKAKTMKLAAPPAGASDKTAARPAAKG